MTNAAGVVMERIEYAHYGSIVHRARESGFEGDLHDTPYLFTGFYGCQTDSNGLIYLRERYYNTLTRRFINPDPARDGWNWYAYAGGDPMGFVDPTGLGQMRTLDILQKTLAVLGMVPGVGEIFDVVNAGISFARGNYSDAAIHLASAIPGIGNAVAGAKMAGGVATASFALVKTKSITSAGSKGGLNLFRAGPSGEMTRSLTHGWKEGDRMLFLPNQGAVKANWKQNAGRLREEMRKGNPIFDSHRSPTTGMQIPAGATPNPAGRFLNAERKLLESRGWKYNPATGAYHPATP